MQEEREENQVDYLKRTVSEIQFKVDPDLEFSNQNFRSNLPTQEENELNTDIKFSIREYPKPYIFAKFSSKAYDEN